VEHARENHELSERHACRLVNQWRGTQRYLPIQRVDEDELKNIRSDNGPEVVAAELRKWLGNVGTGTLYIRAGSPWENGYCESLNGKLRDECLNGEIFTR
jgi:transposase InsO family protein